MKENCNTCDEEVTEHDRYFSTPCGTYCDDCMAQHVKECEVCCDAFPEFKDSFEPDELKRKKAALVVRTIREEWEHYRDSTYPDGIPDSQERECYQAFVAGAFTAVVSCVVIAAGSPETDDAAKNLQNYLTQVQEECRKLITKRTK